MKKYVKPRMWKETEKNFRVKVDAINKDLKVMGIRQKVKMTRFYHALSLHPFYPEDVGISIKQLARKKNGFK